VVLGNLGVAVVGGIICATAQSVNVVIVGMAVAGIGSQLLHDKSPSFCTRVRVLVSKALFGVAIVV
jgi:hypothetical protein